MTTQTNNRLSMAKIWSFFLPLGLSASLVTISHVIINGTLTRALDPDRVNAIIASYAIAMSMLTIVERPAVLLRQTCSALVRDQKSFQSMIGVAQILFFCILLIGGIICYTPVGPLIISSIFGVQDDAIASVLNVYRILMFVSVFSGLRCVYHGVIIFNQRTKWLTIGMILRLAGMYALSVYFIHTGVTSGMVGAVIFLFGMMIEAVVAYFEGRQLVKKLPPIKEEHTVHSKREIFSFYRPLLYSTFVTIWILPVINIMLGKTYDAELAIASFAIAASLVALLTSFFTYFHQIVLNFYRIDPRAVQKFMLITGFMPPLLIGLIAYSPVGIWLLAEVMGVQGPLQAESLRALQAFFLLTLILPWLDAVNGLTMLRGQTRLMLGSQIANFCFMIVTLLLLVWLLPEGGGTIGAWAQSIGMLGELAFISLALRYIKPMDTVLAGNQR